jgi:hypothetical protein
MKDIIRMNQLAGIITEGQARKMMQVLNEEEVDSIENLEKQLESLPLYDKNDKENTTLKYGKYIFFRHPSSPTNDDYDEYKFYYGAFDKKGTWIAGENTIDELLSYLGLKKRKPNPLRRDAKILTNVYYIKDEGMDLKRKGLEEYSPWAGGAVSQAELEENGLYDPMVLRKIGTLYIRKGSTGIYNPKTGDFEDEDGNESSVSEEYIKYI